LAVSIEIEDFMQEIIPANLKGRATFLLFLLVTFCVSIAAAMQSPTLSLFLTDELGASPMQVGIFFTANAVLGIIVSFMLARRSDVVGDRRHLLMFCCGMAVLNAIMFAFVRHYYLLLTVGIWLSSLTTVVTPQLFALAREFAEYSQREVVMFSSLMRAQMSLAWVIGPPLSFALATGYSFRVLYLVGAALFVVALLLICLKLPSVPRVLPDANLAKSAATGWRNPAVRQLFVASMLMWICNLMYIIDMPLYVSHSLHLPQGFAGEMMGLAAGLEIPIMLLAGWLAKLIGKKPLVLFALWCAVIFYALMLIAEQRIYLLLIQIFNALYIGIVAGLMMLWFQDLMPGRAGAATTLFTNSVSSGMIFAGMIQGAVSENFGHTGIYWLAMGLMALSLLMTLRVKDKVATLGETLSVDN
jgi:MFS transporter, SET family, sugar efflux transporter